MQGYELLSSASTACQVFFLSGLIQLVERSPGAGAPRGARGGGGGWPRLVFFGGGKDKGVLN